MAPLQDDAQVLHDFDADLLYGFSTRVTEETLRNFEASVPFVPPKREHESMFDLILNKYEEQMDERDEQVKKAWAKVDRDSHANWRLSGMLLEESDAELALRQENKHDKDSRFDKCVCEDNPALAFEYQKRVRDLQADVEPPYYIDYDVLQHKYRKPSTGAGEEWNFQRNPSALVDSGLMLEFYADTERRDLAQNMHTCAYFSADAEYRTDLDPQDHPGPVNPWTWMYWWLQGHIDGVRWVDLGRNGEATEKADTEYRNNLHLVWNRRNIGDRKRREESPLVEGGHVRARFHDGQHFLPGIITTVNDSEYATVKFKCADEQRIVSKRDIIAIEDPELINNRFKDADCMSAAEAAWAGPAASWFTHHMTGIMADISVARLARFKRINRVLDGIEMLGMLMMDAFREELHRQCRMRVDTQLDALQHWFDFKGKNLTVGAPAGARDPSVAAFVVAQYPWHKHESLRQQAEADIMVRLSRANAREVLEAKDRKGTKPPTNDVLRDRGVFKLIDDVISTRMGYAQVAKKRQGGHAAGRTSRFPFDWDEVIEGRKLITTDLEASLKTPGAATVPLQALRVDAENSQECVSAKVTEMHRFARVAEVGGELVLYTPPRISFGENIVFDAEIRPFSFDETGNHPRVAHGEYTYNVTYDDGTGAAGLPASMLATVDETETLDEGKERDKWENSMIDDIVIQIIIYVETPMIKPMIKSPVVMGLQQKLLLWSDTDTQVAEIRALLEDLVKKQSQKDSVWWFNTYTKIGDGTGPDSLTELEHLVTLIVEAIDAEATVVGDVYNYISANPPRCSPETTNLIVTKLNEQKQWKPAYKILGVGEVLRTAVDSLLNMERKSWRKQLDEMKDPAALEALIHKIIVVVNLPDEAAAAAKKEPAAAAAKKEPAAAAKKEPAAAAAKKEPAAAAKKVEVAKAAAAKKVEAAKKGEAPKKEAPKKEAAKKAEVAKKEAPKEAEAEDDPGAPSLHKRKGEQPPGKGGAGTEADFFTYCSSWLSSATEAKIIAKLKPFDIWQGGIRKGDDGLLADLIRIGVKFAEHFGRWIPTAKDSDSSVAIRASLEVDVKRFVSDKKHNFETLFKLYRHDQTVTRGEYCHSMHEVAWMLGLFPKTPGEVDAAMAADPAALLAEYRQTITYAQCVWLRDELVGFCANGKLHTSALLAGGTHRLQESVLDVLHRSADDHNYDELKGAKFALTEAVWLSLHVHSEHGEATSDELQRKVQAHCRSAYGRLTDDAERSAFQATMMKCTTPGQLVRGRSAEVEMPIEAYPYHARPLFPRRKATGYVTSRALLGATEVTDPSQLKKAQPSPHAAFLRLQDKVFCGLHGEKYVKEAHLPVLYPTRRPWTCSDGLAIRQAHMTSFADKWPKHWHRLRDELPMRVWMQVPFCVSSMHYMQAAGVRVRGRRRAKKSRATSPAKSRTASPAKSPPASPGASPPASPGAATWPTRTFGTRPRPVEVADYARIGGLKNLGMNCWFNSICQFMFRSKMGPRIMEQIRNCMVLFRSSLSEVSASDRPKIMALARKCSKMTASNSEYDDSPKLRSWPIWVLYLSDRYSPGDTVEKYVQDLRHDNEFLCYVVAEMLYDVYKHVNSEVSLSDVVELQYMISYITLPIGATDFFAPGVAQQDASEVFSRLVGVLAFFVTDGSENPRDFMRGMKIDSFESLQTRLVEYTKCLKCKEEIHQPPNDYTVIPVSVHKLTAPTTFSKVLADESEETLIDAATGKPIRNCETCNPNKKFEYTAAKKYMQYTYNEFAVFHLKSEELYMDPEKVGMAYDDKGRDLYRGDMRKSRNCLHLIVEPDVTLDGHVYSLVGTLRHWGGTKGGHWSAFVKQKGEWWDCNDETIRKVSFADAVQQKMDGSSVYTLVFLLFERTKIDGKKEVKREVDIEEEEEEEEEGEENKKEKQREEENARKREKEREEKMKKEEEREEKRKKEEEGEEKARKMKQKKEEGEEKARKRKQKNEREEKRKKEEEERKEEKKKAAERDDLDALAERLTKRRAEREELEKQEGKAKAAPAASDAKVKYKKTCNGIAIEVVFGQITDVNADAVVNAANEKSFQKSDGGMSGALRDLMYPHGKKMGQDAEEDKKILTSMKDVYFDNEKMVQSTHVKECAVGVQATTGELANNYKHVIHAVGPRWYDEHNPSEMTFGQGKNKVNSTIRNVFTAADALCIKSIVFCVISTGIFCHENPNWNSREKTAARNELVDVIYAHCMQSDRDKTPRLERIVVFEYDDPIQKNKVQASGLLQETLALLTKNCGRSEVEDKEEGEDKEGDKKDGEDEADAGKTKLKPLDFSLLPERVKKDGEDEEEPDDLEKGIEDELEVEEDDEPDLEETLVYDGTSPQEHTGLDAAGTNSVVGMPWDNARTFERDLNNLPKLRGTQADKMKSILEWTKTYPILDTFCQGLTEEQKSRFVTTMEALLHDVRNIPDSRKVLLKTLVFHRPLNACETSLSSATVRTLLACAFVGLFRHFKYTGLNFYKIMTREKTTDNPPRAMRSFQKIRCVWNYFEEAYESDEMQTPRLISFRSVQGAKFESEDWRASEMLVGDVHVHSFRDEERRVKWGIDDMCDILEGACWEVDFANNTPGGGVLGVGALQEEIRFLQCPELIVCRLFITRMGDDQAVHVSGYRQFNKTKGYSSNHPPAFEFDKTHGKEWEPLAPNKRKMIVMDATRYKHHDVTVWEGIGRAAKQTTKQLCSHEQFTMREINRELQKAYVGFCTGTDPDPIATGHWGAGDYRGDKKLKALIQVLAAGRAGKTLEYCVWGDHENEIRELIGGIANGTTVGALYTALADSVSKHCTYTAQELQIEFRLGIIHSDTKWFADDENRADFFRKLCPGHMITETEEEEDEKEEKIVKEKEKTKGSEEVKKKKPTKKSAAAAIEKLLEASKLLEEEEVDADVPATKTKKAAPKRAPVASGDDNWFTKHFGFREKTSGKPSVKEQFEINRARFQMDSGDNLCWKDDRKVDHKEYVGHFSVDPVEKLLQQYKNLDYNIKKDDDNRDELTFEHILPEGGVQGLISNPENEHAVFMVASQFNALEMVSPTVTPARGVTMYANDRTQGPACALACPAALIYRNYLLDPRPLDPACTEKGQHTFQLNLMERVEKLIENDKNKWWKMQNGYLMPISKKSYESMETMLESLNLDEVRDQVEVAVHWDTAVAGCEHRVTQVFCSAVGLSYFKTEITPKIWNEHHTLATCVLHAAFYATLAVAAARADELGEEVSVYLTALGAGAFETPVDWVANALKTALREFRKAPLRVHLVHYGSIPEEWLSVKPGTFSQRKAMAVRDMSETDKKKFVKDRGWSSTERTCVLCGKLGTGYVRVNKKGPRVCACSTCLGVDKSWFLLDVDEVEAEAEAEAEADIDVQIMVEGALNETRGNHVLIREYISRHGKFSDETSCANCGAVGTHFVRVHKSEPRVALCNPCLKTRVS